MQIFLARNNVQAGPYSLDQLNIMLASGEVTFDDLVWHDGLDKWQRAGDLTGNQRLYRPSVTPATSPIVSEGIINNVTIFPEDTATDSTQDGKSVSLDRLYGKPESTVNNKTDMTTNNQYKPNNVSLSKSSTTKLASDKMVGNVVLAPIMSRILATVVNGLLYFLTILPLLLALSKMDIDMSKFGNIQNFDAAYQYSMTLMENVPNSTLLTSQAMLFGLLALQLIFITLRGQSLGKLISGIRVVDQTTHRLPSFFRLILTRTILLAIIYNLLFSFASPIGFVAIAIHYYLASKSPQNIGWHDKLAKTLVVKADDSQLNKKTKVN